MKHKLAPRPESKMRLLQIFLLKPELARKIKNILKEKIRKKIVCFTPIYLYINYTSFYAYCKERISTTQVGFYFKANLGTFRKSYSVLCETKKTYNLYNLQTDFIFHERRPGDADLYSFTENDPFPQLCYYTEFMKCRRHAFFITLQSRPGFLEAYILTRKKICRSKKQVQKFICLKLIIPMTHTSTVTLLLDKCLINKLYYRNKTYVYTFIIDSNVIYMRFLDCLGEDRLQNIIFSSPKRIEIEVSESKNID